jgi:BMFP domain-containing protein YqiC
MLFSAMRDRLELLETRIKQLEEQQSSSTATAKLKLVHDGS